MLSDRMVPRKAMVFSGNTMTQAHFQENANINSIMARYKKTGVLGTGLQGFRRPQFGNFVGMDFQEMNNIVVRGNELFMQLSPDIRKRFHNDPGELIQFINDEGNRDEAIKLGFLPKPEAPKSSETTSAPTNT